MFRFLRNALARAVRNDATYVTGQTGGWTDLSGNPVNWGGYSSSAGQQVSQSTAMSLAAVWACVQKTSEQVASLPLQLFEKKADGSRERLSNDLASILSINPNARQTALEFWQVTTALQVMRGNAICERQEVGSSLVGLEPLPTAGVRKDQKGRLVYSVVENGRTRVIPNERVFHLRGFGFGDGIGLSAIQHGANSFGAALAAEEASSSVFANGLNPSAVFESDSTLDATQRAQFLDVIEKFAGSKKAGKAFALEAGFKFKPVSMNPEDAQMLETRRFSIEDVCRWFGVPPIIIGHSQQGQTMWGSGVEAILSSWYVTGINPLLSRIEAQINKDLIPSEHRGRWYAEFNREGMLQMDSKTKGEFLRAMVQGGIMSPDEAREKLNLTAMGGVAGELHMQTAMAPLGESEANQ